MRALHEFIYSYQGLYRVSPSFDEMSVGIGIHSKGNIHRLLRGLQERGIIERVKKRARAITLLKTPARRNAIEDARKLLEKAGFTVMAPAGKQ
jgi:SOS-response transcriptional repressor LexA